MYFTFDGKQEEEFNKWTEKDMDDAISWNLLRQLECKKSTHPKFHAMELWLAVTMAM
jgi:hypothetical protein